MIPTNEHSYLIVIERSDNNYGAWAPDLPGCVAVGDTAEQCEQEMRKAIEFHLEGLALEGHHIPAPRTLASEVFANAV